MRDHVAQAGSGEWSGRISTIRIDGVCSTRVVVLVQPTAAAAEAAKAQAKAA
jgi:hypothetical protein